ncbi:hypothetical protein UF75_2115 [Desulfosporosinus sp. I2]|uniref:CPBP family intramembrane glutamic endopeptidase n=1 Tax=Desulfosporosinus sp. I2 TaxID=1617025 RepID=UPI0005ED6727|nr:CPBP family intramembrane glutamic endopeptidase [Desulfosporosinus sp. I2]KJR47537.1 hypothetical protein UF75_2115 [Desulfosporosinus sp. I2]
MRTEVVKELGVSFLSFYILGVVVYYLAKSCKIKYNGFEFFNPKKSALYSLLSVILSSCMITGLMVLLNSQGTTGVGSNVQKFNLNSVINIVIIWLVMLSPILIMKKIRNESWRSTGISKHNLRQSILIGTILIIITLVSSILFSSKSLSGIGENFNLSVLWAIFYFIVIGFSEEFMFRGYLQIRLIEWLGKWKGLIFTSVFMALIHIPQRMAVIGLSPYEAISSAVLLIPVSLMMGYIMIKTENIVAPGMYHSFINWINIVIYN